MEDINLEDFESELNLEDFEVDVNITSTQSLIESSVADNDVEPPNETVLSLLKRVFGHSGFRQMQWKIIRSIVKEKRDNCTVMATGYGKSLCYQFPAIYLNGLTIVISPLISLMEDQVLSLKILNIPACLLGSANMNQTETIAEIENGNMRIVYATPEFACNEFGLNLFENINRNVKITLFAIDEAHCVSTWGHDFRHSYRSLGKFKKRFPDIPVLAVTATATHRVITDINASLNLKNPQILCTGFDRPNLFFAVKEKSKLGVLHDLGPLLEKIDGTYSFSGSTIIYCLTRKDTEKVAALLKAKGLNCLMYHAGLSMSQRKDAHQQFVKDKIKCIVATVAFGMGIDKPDVRTIIHYGASKDIESYYQEVGRGGRDGAPSRCLTFYAESDFKTHEFLRLKSLGSDDIRKKKDQMSYKMRTFLETKNCRRNFILSHFGEEVKKNVARSDNCCDNCNENGIEIEKPAFLTEDGRFDFGRDASILMNAITELNNRFGLEKYILFLKGSKSAKLPEFIKKSPLHGSGSHRQDNWWKALARHLHAEGFLENIMVSSSTMRYATLGVSSKGTNHLMSSQKNLFLTPTGELLNLLQTMHRPAPQIQAISVPTLKPTTSVNKLPTEVKLPAFEKEIKKGEIVKSTEDTFNLYKKLIGKRTEIADIAECMPYMVASDEVLMKIAELKPTDIREFVNYQFQGFNQNKIKHFAQNLVNVVKDHVHSDDCRSQITDILAEHPLAKSKIPGKSTYDTYNLFESGMSIAEISKSRSLVQSTIRSHLIDLMKIGYPIKMEQLGVTADIRNIIMTVIQGPKINNDLSSMTPIKQNCPEEITYDNIKVVLTYLQLREHLHDLAIPYNDFEDFDYTEMKINVKEYLNKMSPENGGGKQVLSEMVREQESLPVPEGKRAKMDCESDDDMFELLDSPTR